jgi:Xaa-Pro aminopeptidase
VDIQSKDYAELPIQNNGGNGRNNKLSSYVMDGSACHFTDPPAPGSRAPIWSPSCYLLWEPDEHLGTPGYPQAAELFTANRERLARLLPPNSLAVLNANDIPPTNADGSAAAVPNSDLFYLTGVDQEQSILLLYPEADDEKQRELLFLREGTPENERWEGPQTHQGGGPGQTGIRHVHWLAEFPRLFHRLMCECEHVFLNSNEHKRAVIEVESREARFVAETMRRYPLHDYRRLAPLLHQLRAVKSEAEVGLIRRACDVTASAFARVLRFVQPGVGEWEVEAEFAHEFIRHRCRFAYLPIIASGPNACVLHYVANAAVCQKGSLLLLDVAPPASIITPT